MRASLITTHDKTNKDFLVLSFWGIILVVAGHCGVDFLDFGGLLPYYNFHMPLFIFISGYFFSGQKTFKKWILHKAKKLILPYYVINIIYRIFSIFLHDKYNFNLEYKWSLKTILIDPLFPHTLSGFNAAMWFVIILFYIELIYFLAMKCMKFKHRELLFAIIGACIGILCMYFSIKQLHMVDGRRNLYIQTLLRTGTLLPFFSFGNIYHLYIEGKLPISRINIILLIGAVLLITYQICPEYYDCGTHATIDYKYVTFLNIVPTYIVGMCGILFWLQISKLLSPKIGDSAVVQIIGNNTWAIMSHHLFGFFCINSIIAFCSKYFAMFPTFDMLEFLEKPRNSIYNGFLSNWYYLIISIVISLLIQFIINTLKTFVSKK